ncbi:MAG: class I SAM-dependent methyltransferase [Paracoccaceae bacterium]
MARHGTYTTIARFYDLFDLPFEYFRYRKIRKTLWRGLEGRILDAGVGTGRNMHHYPETADMVGIDLSPMMLARAAARQRRTGVAVELLKRDVLFTGFEDDEFDVIVSSFLFCVLDDHMQLPALQELRRVCREDGEIRILEYSWSKNRLRRFVMALWAPWVSFAYGARFDRDTAQYVRSAGLDLIENRFVHGDIIRLLVLRPAKRKATTEDGP